MISARRFVRFSLVKLPYASFAKNSRSFKEYIEALDTEKVLGPKTKAEVIDEETLKFLQEKITSKKVNLVMDKDNYRIDCGFMISRDPIFLTYDKDEMEHTKLKHKFNKKYKNYAPVGKELWDFKEKTPSEEFEKNNPDNLTTHYKQNPDGTSEKYSRFSKLWNLTDPNMADRHSIQYASTVRPYLLVKAKGHSEWTFPSFKLDEKMSFSTAREVGFRTLSESKWRIYYADKRPVCLTERGFTAEEKEDVENRRAVGVRTIWFHATHQRGLIHLNPELYDDFAWVPRLELNKFFNKEEYTRYVHSMHIL